jgi:hypothetical protein
MGNTIQNNVFLNSRGNIKLSFNHSTQMTMEKNIIWAKGAVQFSNPEGVTTWNNNLLFSKSNLYPTTPKIGVGSPEFVDPSTGDYAFRINSPAIPLGIKPLDLSDVGPRKLQQAAP